MHGMHADLDSPCHSNHKLEDQINRLDSIVPCHNDASEQTALVRQGTAGRRATHRP